jgi:hypothetical protein
LNVLVGIFLLKKSFQGLFDIDEVLQVSDASSIWMAGQIEEILWRTEQLSVP